MIKLHHSPGTASMIPHIVLQELGVPFELARAAVQRVMVTEGIVPPLV